MSLSHLVIPKNYQTLFENIKKRICSSQIKAAIKVNEELLKLYWEIGKEIAERQEREKWGSEVIEKLGKDLQNAFPGIEGFSRRNIFRMRAFYLAYQKVPQAVAQIDSLPIFRIPWGHNAILIEKVKDIETRLWYAEKAIEHGWSRNMLELWIKSNLHSREGKAITNFQRTLPSSQSDLAQQTLKDPYLFDFLALHKDHIEQELEAGLIENIQKFLIELGQGFAFVGRQVNLHLGDVDYYIDLLFYHLKLRCYCIVELKNTPFKPEYTGKMGLYLAAVDEKLKHSTDTPSIGMILCKSKDKLTVEYTLRGNNNPIGVSSYETQIFEKLPKELKNSLPTIEEIEAELSNK